MASYLVMFLYVSLTLGSGIPWQLIVGSDSPVRYVGIALRNAAGRLVHGKTASERAPSVRSDSGSSSRLNIASWLPAVLSVNSKFTLGLFGIIIVLVAVSSSVGFFSLMGVRVTLIIAEVIPFLVLAVGVDNVFILVHELDRQNTLHGPGVGVDRSIQGDETPGGLRTDDDEDEDASILPDQRAASDLAAEERVARALARMGPSILLSSVTEVVAFGLGALVPMPAVRNFALYAAGSVLLGATLQVTVFISAMALDLRRVEVSDYSLLSATTSD